MVGEGPERRAGDAGNVLRARQRDYLEPLAYGHPLLAAIRVLQHVVGHLDSQRPARGHVGLEETVGNYQVGSCAADGDDDRVRPVSEHNEAVVVFAPALLADEEGQPTE